MTAVEDARATRSRIDDRLAVGRLGRSLTREMDADMLALKEAGASLDALIAEHEATVREMHARELHHFETEKLLTEQGIDPDKWEYAVRDDSPTGYYGDITECGTHPVTRESFAPPLHDFETLVRRRPAGPWEPVQEGAENV